MPVMYIMDRNHKISSLELQPASKTFQSSEMCFSLLLHFILWDKTSGANGFCITMSIDCVGDLKQGLRSMSPAHDVLGINMNAGFHQS